MRTFGVVAGSLISASQETCDVGHSRSDEVLIENLGMSDGGASRQCLNADFGFLIEIHLFYFLLCFCF